MPEYTFLCRSCDKEFERFSWGELSDGDGVCPTCDGQQTTVRWVIELPFENLANFGCA